MQQMGRTNVACYHVELGGCLSQPFCSLLHQILMAGAMCSISADVLLLIELPRQSIQICSCRHGLMESCVEHCDLHDQLSLYLLYCSSRAMAGLTRLLLKQAPKQVRMPAGHLWCALEGRGSRSDAFKVGRVVQTVHSMTIVRLGN